MTGESIIREPEVAEYEKIRKYVVGQLAKAGSKPMRLASNRELAKKFDVSHPTVIRALKDLVDDGYLTVKPGVGMFTVPGRLNVPGRAKIIGTLYCDGKAVIYCRSYWCVMPPLFEATLAISNSFQLCHSFLSGRGSVDEELLASGVDGVIASFPEPEKVVPALQKLRKAGMPVMAFGARIPGVDCIDFDYFSDCKNLASAMLAEGRKNILLAVPDAPPKHIADDAIAGVAAAYGEAGLPAFKNWVSLPRPMASPDLNSFNRALDVSKPDALIFSFEFGPDFYWDALKSRVDVEEGCRVGAASFSISKNMDFSGYAAVPEFGQEFELAAAGFMAQFGSAANDEAALSLVKSKITRVKYGGKP